MNQTPNVASHPANHWLLSLVLGSSIYAAFNGLVHFSDWCYLVVSTAVAALASAAVLPLYGLLLRQLARHGQHWPALGRWVGLGGSTLVLFGLANLLVWPLRTWPGPGGTWPWGVAAVVVASLELWQRPAFLQREKRVLSHNEKCPEEKQVADFS